MAAAICLPSTSLNCINVAPSPPRSSSAPTSSSVSAAFPVRAAAAHGKIFEASRSAPNQRRTSVKVFAASADAPEEKKVPQFKKGDIVRVLKEKYIGSVEALAVDHPAYFTGLDYIYEDRGEILDVRFFDAAGEYALIQWAGIPTAPAWLPASMLQKAAKLAYLRS